MNDEDNAKACTENGRHEKFYSVIEADWEKEEDRERILDAILTILGELTGSDSVEADEKDNGNHTDHNLALNGNSTDDSEHEGFHERAKFIPLRLRPHERKLQRLVDNCLLVSGYTDRVDRPGTKRSHAIIKGLHAMLSGVVAGVDIEAGRQLVKLREFDDLKDFIASAFEVARRHRLANPELLRGDYTKLIHVLQDTIVPEIKEQLGISCISPLLTVERFLRERNATAMLDDPQMATATKEILPAGKTRAEINAEIRDKERAVEKLARKYKRDKEVTDEEIRHCLYSIGDNNVYLRFARDPCDEMIAYLTKYFSRDEPENIEDSLAIMNGRGGARLTHDHRRQYEYVLQTLWLWREVLHDMYRLLIVAEMDLLSPNESYELRNTGQGFNRVQKAPRLKREMEGIVKRVKRRVPSWIGSDVIHLGDHNVPNALMFIDKYAQVPRILLPLTTTLRHLDAAEDDDVLIYIDHMFGSVDRAKKTILRDFYRHAFDGSGADNFFDAGSCIDGRLTSAWNWCNGLEDKRFNHLFKILGFGGFDASSSS